MFWQVILIVPFPTIVFLAASFQLADKVTNVKEDSELPVLSVFYQYKLFLGFPQL